jgi:hypothetical protein
MTNISSEVPRLQADPTMYQSNPPALPRSAPVTQKQAFCPLSLQRARQLAVEVSLDLPQ